MPDCSNLPRAVAMRQAEIARNTLETQITAKVNLDGSSGQSLRTGVLLLTDYMLDQIVRHGLIDIDIEAGRPAHRRPPYGGRCRHHPRPGAGPRLGRQEGLTRYGHSYVPLDEALTRVVIDLSGRPGLGFQR